MTIAAQLNAVVAALKAWCETRGSTAEVAGDPFHLLALLQTKPGSVRAVVLFAGETKRGEIEESGIVDRSFSVVLSRGQGLTLSPGDSLVKGAGGGPPLFQLVEEARQIVRGLQFEDTLVIPIDSLTTEVTPNYLGCEPFAVDDKRLDAYQLNFQIGTQLPAA